MKKKAPKFFCENCGEEVKENAKICTHCGKFFTNIRCPKCFHQGDSSEFKNGCPECGYSNNKNNFNQKDENESKKYNGNFFKNYIKKYYPEQNKKSRENSLPAWIYIFTLAVLITIIIAFYSCLIK